MIILILVSAMQPLHVGFTSDKGANTIDVHWYKRKEVLHHVSFPWNIQHMKQPIFHIETELIQILQVWDRNIIETAEQRFYDSNVDELIDALQKNITVPYFLLISHQKLNNPFPCYVFMIMHTHILKLDRLYGLTKQRHGKPAAKQLAQMCKFKHKWNKQFFWN